MNNNQAIPGSSVKRRAALNRFGTIVLILGLGIAILVDWGGQARSTRQPNPQGNTNAVGEWQDTTLPSEDTKQFSRDVEMNYGKVGVLVAKGQIWWENLQPSERWAIVIATISIIASVGCFLGARNAEV